MAALWFPRIRRMAQTASTGRWNGITILRLEPMAALWFPRIGRMGILTTNLAWCFGDYHIRYLAGSAKRLHVIGGTILRD